MEIAKKIQVYFMPGMAANHLIFEGIKLPEEEFDVHHLSWKVPSKDESLSHYAKRMLEDVHDEHPVLIGVSFGGVLVQEMAKYCQPKKVIIISSVKTHHEMPRRMRFASKTGIHKLLPTKLVQDIETVAKYAFGKPVVNRLDLYQKYLSVRDPYYLKWAIDQVVNWKQDVPLKGLVHIHGEKDQVFPSKYVKQYVPVENGTHIMIINRYKWFNERLPKIIKE